MRFLPGEMDGYVIWMVFWAKTRAFFEHEVLLELFLFFFKREIMLFSRENFGFQMIDDFGRSQMISEIE